MTAGSVARGQGGRHARGRDRLALRITLTSALAILTACETMPKAISNLPFADKLTSAPSVQGALPPPEARTWPDNYADVMNQRARGYGLARMPNAEAYLNALHARIKTLAGVPQWPGRVYVLGSPTLDAYVTSAGNIYLSQMWLASAESEDEIVALLSHEFSHVYLHYHQIDASVQEGDQAAGLAAFTVGLIEKPVRGWNHTDTLSTSYALGRDVIASAWGRSQESAADNLGLNLSLKLGYGYEAGFKTLLERIASWEEQNAARQKTLSAELQDPTGQATAARVMQEQARKVVPNSGALNAPIKEASASVGNWVAQSRDQLGQWWKSANSSHPDIAARMDTLAKSVDALPPTREDPAGRVAPWKQMQSDPQTATILNNYRLATQALANLEDPKAPALAQQAASGPTARHALPLLALYKSRLAQPARAAAVNAKDPGAVLDANLTSDADRSWAVYLERAMQLQSSRQYPAARRVMDTGFAYFDTARDAWPEAIRFTGQTQGWPQAKTLAASCAKRFAGMAAACNEAASSPAEQTAANADRLRKERQVVDQVIKTR